jgi:hypothetical protein
MIKMARQRKHLRTSKRGRRFIAGRGGLKKDTCYFCEEKKFCIIEDVGGLISADNQTTVCLDCAIGDRFRRQEEGELTWVELHDEIKEILEKSGTHKNEVRKVLRKICSKKGHKWSFIPSVSSSGFTYDPYGKAKCMICGKVENIQELKKRGEWGNAKTEKTY